MDWLRQCQQQRGNVVAPCLDGFLFGACCHVSTSGAMNSVVSLAVQAAGIPTSDRPASFVPPSVEFLSIRERSLCSSHADHFFPHYFLPFRLLIRELNFNTTRSSSSILISSLLFPFHGQLDYQLLNFISHNFLKFTLS